MKTFKFIQDKTNKPYLFEHPVKGIGKTKKEAIQDFADKIGESVSEVKISFNRIEEIPND